MAEAVTTGARPARGRLTWSDRCPDEKASAKHAIPVVSSRYRWFMAKKKWSDLTTGQQRAIFVAGAAEAALTTAALWDLAHRPAANVRGRKAAWILAFFVQPVGPLAYFAKGRH